MQRIVTTPLQRPLWCLRPELDADDPLDGERGWEQLTPGAQ